LSKKPSKVTQTKGYRTFMMQSGLNIYTVVITKCGRDSQQSNSIETAEQDPPMLEQVRNDIDLYKRWLAGTMRMLK